MADTDGARIVGYYQALSELAPGPVVALNHRFAVAELHGIDAGHAALVILEGDARLASYSFYWAARADLERRSGRVAEAMIFYRRASRWRGAARRRRVTSGG